MTDEDQKVIFSLHGDSGPPERPTGYDGLTEAEDQPADLGTGLVSLGFITAAIRRRARFWCSMAVVGLVIGCGLYASSLHRYQASTSVLLTLGPYETASTAPANDQAMAQSRAVAALALHKLGLQQDVGSFLATYNVTPITERVLLITASAPSSDQAVIRANAVAAAFQKFRADEMQTEQQLVLASLQQQVGQAQSSLNSINAHISRLSTQPMSLAQQSQLKELQAKRAQAADMLSSFQQAVSNNQTVIQPATAAAVKGSVVLNPATSIVHSRFKPLVLDAVLGLIVGLILGMAIVVIQAIVTDKLRRRDDVAQALGAPVKLSVSRIRLNRWLPGRRGNYAARNANIQRIVAYLGYAVPGSSRGVATLAVIPVDDLQVSALSLVSLAVSCAEQGKRVVVADLCSGAPAAKLLGAKDPGIHEVKANSINLVVAVPERDDVIPVGPLRLESAQTQRSVFTEAVAAGSASADLLLTLITLDPSLGGDHLPTWAADAVVVVTAGRSSWTKINSVGEMIRLSGTRLVSGILVGADSTDETLGMASAQHARGYADAMEQALPSDGNGFMLAVGNMQGKYRSANNEVSRE